MSVHGYKDENRDSQTEKVGVIGTPPFDSPIGIISSLLYFVTKSSLVLRSSGSFGIVLQNIARRTRNNLTQR